MTALDRKLLRDLLQMKGQALAISAVLACGVAMFVMSLTTLASLEQTMDRYYRDYRFGDVFAFLKRAPDALSERIEAIPGVARVQTRVVADVNLQVRGLDDPAVARLISLPDRGAPVLNDLYLRRGRWIEPDRAGEALVSETFAQAHDLRPGDTVRVIINQRQRELTIVGIALSPEFIYEIREGELLPDPLRFGVFWMSRRELAAAFDMEGAFNNVVLSLMPTASEKEVIAQLDRLTERYGGLGAFGRDEQTSHRFISGEIDQLRGMATIVPVIFLAVAAFLFNMVISRMIATQREQIAALKAFGYTRREIGAHYATLVGLIVLSGVALGAITGMWLGQSLVELYVRFFKFPLLQYVIDFRAIAPAIFFSGVAAFAGTFTAVRRAVLLPPAEAMRPEPPAAFRPTFVERMGLQRLFSQSIRMVLRNLERQPIKSLLTCFGMALATSILILGNLNSDIIDRLIDFEFNLAQRQDMTVTFSESSSERASRELTRMPGVLHVEPFRAAPIRLRSAHVSRRTSLLGLEPQRDLFRLLDEHEREIAIPPDGLLLSAALAELLRIKVGEVVHMEVLEGRRPELDVAVAGMIEDYTGLAAYMDIDALRRLLREQDSISGAFLTVDRVQTASLFSQLRETPRVASVTIKRAAIESFQETIAQNLLTMRAFTVAFASIIAFGVIYNSARISLSERGRELATLRVIGFTRGEISLILLGELTILTLASIPIGLLFGYWLGMFTIESLQTEHQRLPLVIGMRTYAFAALVTIIAALLSGLFVRRRLDRLDLIAVLKSQA
ncbi:MAG TPA: ABC transporter permease [Phycisphaerales bacterium]|nr:ABC transporter permease [Phycisphaerales bacterium]HRQ74933.1 ABC transporter permease [Phycisphaerales bacterium]